MARKPKAGTPLDGQQVVTTNAIQRNEDGPEAIAHLCVKDETKRIKRLELADEVAKVGGNNRQKALNAFEKRQQAARKKMAQEDIKRAEADLKAAQEMLKEKKADLQGLGA